MNLIFKTVTDSVGTNIFLWQKLTVVLCRGRQPPEGWQSPQLLSPRQPWWHHCSRSPNFLQNFHPPSFQHGYYTLYVRKNKTKISRGGKVLVQKLHSKRKWKKAVWLLFSVALQLSNYWACSFKCVGWWARQENQGCWFVFLHHFVGATLRKQFNLGYIF